MEQSSQFRRPSTSYPNIRTQAADPAPAAWWVPEPDYATPAYEADYEAGEEYSYIQFVGLSGGGMLSTVDLPGLGTRFELPVYLVQGAEDLVTAPEVSRAWFDTVEAPRKRYVLVERAGHDPNPATLDAVRRILEAEGRRSADSR